MSVTSGGATYRTAYTHDAFGRIATSTQTTGANPAYVFHYRYSLADQLTQLQYPSGHTVNYTPDSLGRITGVQNAMTMTNYATLSYTPAGGISSLALANGVTEQLSWNDRLQLTGIAAAASGTTALALGLYPCPGQATACATGNTGNILTQTIAAPGLSLTQSYTYDAVNRLTGAAEGSGSWSQTYGFDNSGNRWVSGNSGFNLGSFTPAASSNFNTGNRLQIQNSLYDAEGNQTAIGAQGSTFDAEGRMTSNTLNGTTTYVYDGEGQRVMKQTAAGTTVYVYDAEGNLAAEYATAAQASACGTATCYVTVDQIGSTRLVTDSVGQPRRRYDYLPWGEEIPAGTGGRTAAMGYGTAGDGFNPKFTGQMRDVESGLDYFHARYYSPEQGRFVSADPGNAGADVGNPQTWNGYAYVGGNPLIYTDPSGESWLSWLGIGLAAGAAVFTGGASSIAVGLFGVSAHTAATAATVLSISAGIAGAGSVGTGLYGSFGSSPEVWGEQAPLGMGVSVNTGGVFGSGNTDPFIFSATIQASQSNPDLFSNWPIDAGFVFTAEAIAKMPRGRRTSNPLRDVVTDIKNAPWSGNVFVPLYGPLGVQVGVNGLGSDKGSCLSIAVAAGVGRSVSAGTYGGPLSSGDKANSGSILSGWGGSASAIPGPGVGYQVAYGRGGAIGGLAFGMPGFSFSYGYSFCH